MAENLGASFSIDVSDLSRGLQQANRLIRESESQFKAAAAGMDDWQKSEAGLTAKIKSLNQITDLQQKKVDALQSEYDSLIANGLDPTSKKAVDLRTKINNETAALERNKKQTADLENALQEFRDEAERTGRTVDEVANDIEDMGDKTEDAGDGFTVAKGAVAGFIANGLTALVGAVKNAIGSILGLAESTREYRNEMSKLETAFEESAVSTDSAKKAYKDLYSVLGDEGQSVEAANHLAKLVNNEKELEQWTTICTGVYGAFGASLPIEGLTEASNETAKVGKVTGNLADALNWTTMSSYGWEEALGSNKKALSAFNKATAEGASAEDAFNAALAECSTEQERTTLITETLNAMYGDSAAAFKENNKEVIAANKAQADYTDSSAKLGEKVEPITTKVKEGFNKILEKVLELTEDVDFDALGEQISSAFDTFINEILPKIESGLQWIIDNKDGIIAGIAGIGAAFAAFKVVSIIQSVTSALKGMSIAQAALNLVMSMNPIGLIVAAVAGLVAAFVVLWNKCEGFRNFWIGLWDGIKSAVGTVVDWIKENWQTMLLFLVNPLAGIFKYLYEHFEGFRNFVDGIVQRVKQFFSDLWESIKNIFSAVSTWFIENVFQPLYDFFYPFIYNLKILITGTWEIIKAVFSIVAAWFNENVIQPVANFFSGLWNGISSAAKTAWGVISGIFSAVAGWFKNKVITPVVTTFTGLWNKLKSGASNAWDGIKSVFSKVASFFGDIFGKAWSKVKDIFSTGGKIFDGIKDGIVSAFKNIVNAIIRGINKVVAVPFNAINKVLEKIRNVSVAGVSPFKNLISSISVPEIPQLAKGGVIKRATTAIIGEDGAEAVVPLSKNREWIKEVAKEMAAANAAIQNKAVPVVNQVNHFSQAHSRYELFKAKEEAAAAVKLVMLGVKA